MASEFQSLILRIKELEEIVAELKRNNEGKAGVKLSISSFYDRFTPKMVDFLQRCVLHAIEFQAQQPGRVLGDKLNRFKDLVIQVARISCEDMARRKVEESRCGR